VSLTKSSLKRFCDRLYQLGYARRAELLRDPELEERRRIDRITREAEARHQRRMARYRKIYVAKDDSSTH
jgi:hypothetical protein